MSRERPTSRADGPENVSPLFAPSSCCWNNAPSFELAFSKATRVDRREGRGVDFLIAGSPWPLFGSDRSNTLRLSRFLLSPGELVWSDRREPVRRCYLNGLTVTALAWILGRMG